MKKLLEKFDDFLVKLGWYRFLRFVDYWIYPAYYLRNLLFHRFDRVKVPEVKPYEYIDISEMVLYTNMKLIVDFIEKENPEKHICWYTDEDGAELGHKYGERPNTKILFPEYKDRWIMDIIKEIYNYWKVIYPLQNEKRDYLLKYWSKYLAGNDMPTFATGEEIKTKEDLYLIPSLNWSILDSCIYNRNDLLNSKIVHNKINELDKEIYDDCQKYLHLIIEIRSYLWT